MTTADEELATTEKRKQNPSRFRKAKSSARLAGVQATIEELMGLPNGSVQIGRAHV